MQLAKIIVTDFIEHTGSDFIRYGADADLNRMTVNSDKRTHRGKTIDDIRAMHTTYGRLYVDSDMLLDLYLLHPNADQNIFSVILDGAIGLVYVVDCHDRKSFPAITTTIATFGQVADVPLLVVAIGLETATLSREDIKDNLHLPEHAIVRECDMQDGDAVRSCLMDLLYLILDNM